MSKKPIELSLIKKHTLHNMTLLHCVTPNSNTHYLGGLANSIHTNLCLKNANGVEHMALDGIDGPSFSGGHESSFLGRMNLKLFSTNNFMHKVHIHHRLVFVCLFVYICTNLGLSHCKHWIHLPINSK